MGPAGPCCTTGNRGCIGKEGPGGPGSRQQNTDIEQTLKRNLNKSQQAQLGKHPSITVLKHHSTVASLIMYCTHLEKAYFINCSSGLVIEEVKVSKEKYLISMVMGKCFAPIVNTTTQFYLVSANKTRVKMLFSVTMNSTTVVREIFARKIFCLLIFRVV